MFLAAALPAPAPVTSSFTAMSYVDIIVMVWLLVGLLCGRRRGMTQEVLPTIQWVLIAALAGLFYAPFGGLIAQVTSGAFTHLWANVTAYVIIAFVIHLFFVWIKQGLDEKLTGSDYFGRSEYYLGMAAGLVRFACMFIVLVAIMHSYVYTQAELAETEKMQKKNFEDIRFPTYGSIQHAVLSESVSGRWISGTLSCVMITTAPSAKPTPPTIGQKESSLAKK
jgi:uncharacterized membrane protein required for colicin V production